MPKIKNIGSEVYNCGIFSAAPGEVIEVAEEKAKQLLSDFPANWEHQEPSKIENTKNTETVKSAPAVSPKNRKADIKNKK